MDKLTDEEKTIVLAKLAGWGVSKALAGTKYESVFIYTQDNQRCQNLYDPANMALAWRVLNWASGKQDAHPEEQSVIQLKIQRWLTYHVGWLDILPPAKAQRAWLDKILELATEAGMIENGH